RWSHAACRLRREARRRSVELSNPRRPQHSQSARLSRAVRHRTKQVDLPTTRRMAAANVVSFNSPRRRSLQRRKVSRTADQSPMKLSLACLLCLFVAQIVCAQSWPHPIPARIRDGSNRDLMVMTLGDVAPTIADGVFDPSKDELRFNDGTILKNYFRDTLKIKYFQPIDKTRFPLPPSGWC